MEKRHSSLSMRAVSVDFKKNNRIFAAANNEERHMEVFLAALIIIGFGVAGMCFNIIFRKNGQFPQTDVGSNENMRKLGIRCMREEDDERFSKKGGKDSGEGICSGTYSDSCTGCGLYPLEKRDK